MLGGLILGVLFGQLEEEGPILGLGRKFVQEGLGLFFCLGPLGCVGLGGCQKDHMDATFCVSVVAIVVFFVVLGDVLVADFDFLDSFLVEFLVDEVAGQDFFETAAHVRIFVQAQSQGFLHHGLLLHHVV